jgi:hypothetical protein
MLSTEDGKDQDAILCTLATLIAQYSNPHLFPFDLGTLSKDEIQSELEALKDIMKEMIG